jgi:Protein of unknown function (DUF2628)
MRVYSVHAPPEEPISPEEFLFVKDGFSWPALFFPVLWILWHRMWLTLVWYIVFVLAVAWAGRLGGDNLGTTIAIIGAVFFALEANNFRRLSLEGRGFSEVGAASGRNYSEAETRFFGAWAEEPEAVPEREAIARAAYSPEARSHGADEPILGLFPEPEH